MPTIYDVVNANVIAKKWTENYIDRVPYLGEAFFAERKQLGNELSYLEGKRPAVRPLNLSSYDVKVIPIGREGFKTITTEIPFFKNSKVINEKQRQQLNIALQTGNEKIINPLVNEVYNDQKSLLDNADVTREMMRMQLLTSGAIAFANNGQAVSLDFKVPADNKKSTNWSNPTNADPLTDIVNALDYVEAQTGVRPDTVVMNSVTMNQIAKADAIKNAVYVFGNGKVTPSTNEARKYIEREAQVSIYVYNKGYTSETTGEFVKFVADNVVSMFVAGNVGEGVFGTTPEESDLMTESNAKVEIVDLGVAITSTKETDPVNVQTKVSMNYLPVLNDPSTLVILDTNA